MSKTIQRFNTVEAVVNDLFEAMRKFNIEHDEKSFITALNSKLAALSILIEDSHCDFLNELENEYKAGFKAGWSAASGNEPKE